MICLQRPLWSSPEGPPAKFNDDIILEATDEVAPDKTRQSRHRTHDLVSDSGPDEPSMTSKQKKRVTKSRRQEARDFEVCVLTFILSHSHLCSYCSLEASVGRARCGGYKASV